MKQTIILFFGILILTSGASAWWPTTVQENLAVSAVQDTQEVECTALAYPDEATLVVFRKYDGYGNQYQIIDKYGQLKYPINQCLVPGNPTYLEEAAKAIPDGHGGAYVVWPRYQLGILAQRLDSLGNIMWGDSGKVIFPIFETTFDISVDGQGGLFLAISPDETDWSDLYVQRVDSSGNNLWGPQGVLVSGIPNSAANYPRITHGSQGDAYVAWWGSYGMWGAIYMQRVSSFGVKMWSSDLFLCASTDWKDLIPDGEGGVIIQSDPNGLYNTHWRVGPAGNIVWTRDHLSAFQGARMMEGEPGYFYVGFITNPSVYGQKVRVSDGSPQWAIGQPGAAMGSFQTGWTGFAGARGFSYKYPYFYGTFGFSQSPSSFTFFGQALDSLGNPVMGGSGVLMCRGNDQGYYQYVNAVPCGDAGLVMVFEALEDDSLWMIHDIWAKRANFDGTLGGPLPPVEETTISISGDDVLLNWESMGAGVEYNLYFSEEPYVFPANPDTTISDTTFIDVGGGNAEKRFYRVIWEP